MVTTSAAATSSVPAPNNAGLIAVFAALIVLAGFMFAPQVLNDGDTYWHIAAGQWMLAHGQVPTTDPFSFSKAGAPWEAHEWLSEVLMAAAYKLGGWSGLVALFGAVTAGAVGLFTLRLGRSLQGLGLMVTVLLACACVAPSLLARPHILVLPIIVAWLGELIAARQDNRAPRLVFAFLIILWANLHGSYVFAYLLVAPFALEALVEAKTWPERRQVLHGWGLFGIAAVAAAIVTPHGFAGLIFPFKLMTMTILDGISEWRSADFSKFGSFEIVLLVTVFVCLQRGVRVAPLRLALLVFLLHMALRHERHLLILGVTGSMILAQPLAIALQSPHAGPLRMKPMVLGLFAAAALALTLGRLALPITRVDNPTTPATALAALPAGLKTLPVLNDYNFGGYMIFKGMKPFIDGRADMYGNDFVARYFKLASPDAATLDAVLDEYDIGWTMFAPGHPLIALMDARPGWRRLYADKYAVVHVHEEEPPAVFAAAALEKGPAGPAARAHPAG